MNSGPGIQEIREVAEEGLSLLPVAVDDVSVARAGRRNVVRVIVARALTDLDPHDHTSQVAPLSLDEIAQASRRVEQALDASDVLGASPYTLEVTSSGVGTPLSAPEHFRRNVGRLVEVTGAGGEVSRQRLVWAGPDGVRLGDVSAEPVPWADIRQAVVHVEFSRASTGGDI
jgi:ribosome maturation factor RimP